MNENLVRHMRDRPVDIAKLVGFDRFTELHNTWIKLMTGSTEDYTLLGHRSSYKTSAISAAIANLIVLKPWENIIFLRKTETDIKEIIKQANKILETNLYHWIVREIHGVELVVISNAFEIDTNLNISTRGASQLIGMGINGSLTGKHASIIFTDDIVNLRDRISSAVREQTKLQYQELQNVKNRDGRIFNTGTPWHKDDAISTLMPNINRYDCYSTGLIDKEQIKKLRESMSPSLFAANYELKHIADENAMFGEPYFISDVAAIYDGVAHIDAAYGGEDYTAYTVMKKTADGKYIAFGKLWGKHVDDCIDEIAVLHEKYRAGSISNEKNADKGYLAKELKTKGFEVNTYSESTNKYIKISTHLRAAWDDIYWLDDTDPEYLSQILDYTENAAHDDAPDSAASLIRNMEKKKYTYNRNIKGGL